MSLWTKNGRPLQIVHEIVYSRSGKVVGRIHDHKVYSHNGLYVGTIAGDRLVYRHTDSGGFQPAFSVGNHTGTSAAHVAPAAIQGEEPNIPD